MVPPEFHGHELCVIAHSRSKGDRKSTRLNSSHDQISYAVFCLKKKKKNTTRQHDGTKQALPPDHDPHPRPGTRPPIEITTHRVNQRQTRPPPSAPTLSITHAPH